MTPPAPPFTPEQEARLREIVREELAAPHSYDRTEAITEHLRLRRRIERGADAVE